MAEADPPLLPHVTDPLTGVRSHTGKDVPILSVELVEGSDVLEMTCSPTALGPARWASLETLTFPTIGEIEEAAVRSVLAAGSQPCPPIGVGVGVGVDFDHAARGAETAHRAPADIEGGALFHLGSSVRSAGDGWAIDYVNLTTSARFNHLMPEVLRRFGRACSGAWADSTTPAPARSGRSAVPTCPSSAVPPTR